MGHTASASRQIPAPHTARPRTPWPRSRTLDVACAALVAVLQLGGAWAAGRHHHPAQSLDVVDVMLLIVGPAALLARRRHPVAVMWVTFLAALGPGADQIAYLSLLIAFFFAAVGGHRRAAWVMLAAGYVVSVWVAPPILGQAQTSISGALTLGGWLLVLGIAAEAVRIRRERAAAAAAAHAAQERMRAGSRKLGIARELHDVIGHNISLINLQAGVGLDLFETRPDEAREALAAIREVSGEALDELRAMLASLRDDEPAEGAPRAPVPDLDQLPELVEPACNAGLSVTVERTGTTRPLGRAVELAAYRIIQESLTNVARHAPGATVTIGLAYTRDGLELRVCDRGPAGHGHARHRQNGHGPTGALPHDRPLGHPGSGIAGMRERAEALGGSLEADRMAGGGFEVRAQLPAGGAG